MLAVRVVVGAMRGALCKLHEITKRMKVYLEQKKYGRTGVDKDSAGEQGWSDGGVELWNVRLPGSSNIGQERER